MTTPEFISSISWPLITLIALALFRKQIAELISHLNYIKIQHAGTHIELQKAEAKQYAEQLLELIDQMANDMGPDEKDALRKILTHGPHPSVSSVFEKFERGSKDHVVLQRLRNRQFITPAEGGKWEGDKHIEIRKFGSLMIKMRNIL